MSELNGPPDSWILATIDEVCDFHAGFGFPTEMQGVSGRDLPFYKVKDVSIAWLSNSSQLLETEHSLSFEDAKSIKAKPVPEGTVIFAKIGEALRLNRRALAPKSCLIDNNLMGISAPPTRLANRYLYWFTVATKFDVDARASVVPSIRKSDVGNLPFPLPPLPEQTRIVAKLEELLSDLDAGVAELKAAQKKLGQYRQSLLKAAVEGALTAEWRAKNTPSETGAQLLQRILSDRRARWEAKQLAKFAEQGKTPPKDWQTKYPEPVQPDTTDLPNLPEGWVWASVDCLLSDIETGKSFKCEERPPHDHEVGVVKVSAVSWGEYNEQESKTCHDESKVRQELFVNKGDFLFSRANTIELVGACVIVKGITKRVMLSDKILRLILVNDDLKTWLLTLLRSEFGRKYIERLASGNQESMRNIGQERLRQIPVPLPCFDEITKASELLSENILAAQGQEHAIIISLKQSTAQRQNILRAAFAGQLVPQDPNDEPACVLLERIRAERAAQASVKKPRGRQTPIQE